MLEKIASFIDEYNLFDGGSPILVGVSGGLDSVSALLILKKLGYSVVCAHFDHQLRQGSQADAAAVKQLATELEVPFAGDIGNVSAYAAQEKRSIEEAGRLLRYRFLFDLARRIGGQAIVTGHTADDQVETVLMHFLRGSGLSGLKGMLPATIIPSFDAHIPLTRPLLCVGRLELEEFAGRESIKYRVDPSNADLTFYRNRLRHELLPLLETYNPGIRKTILRSAQVLTLEDAALSDVIESVWKVVARGGSHTWVQLDRKAFVNQSRGIQARMLRKATAGLRPSLRDLDFDAVARGLAAANSGAVFRSADLVGGLRVLVEVDSIWVAENWEDLPPGPWPSLERNVTLPLKIPGEVALGNGWVLAADWMEKGNIIPENDAWFAVLDADRLESALTVRPRRRGEHFDPYGMQGKRVRLSDYMINEKLPKRVRAGWPLVASGDRIVWVGGMRLADHVAIDERTTRRLRLRLFRR